MGLQDRWTGELSSPLPEHMRGLEGLVIEEAGRLAEDPTTQAGVEAAVPAVISCIDHRISQYEALARVATNPKSLPGRLAVARGWLDPSQTTSD